MIGLLGQQLAPPLAPPPSLVALPFGRPAARKGLNLTRTGGLLNVSSESPTISTPWFDVQANNPKRDNAFMTSWTQLTGPPGSVFTDGPMRARLQHGFSSRNSYPISWRCDVLDRYGRRDALQVDFTLSYTEPALPPLWGYGTPVEMQMAAVDPGTRQVTVHFGVVMTSGVAPFEYDWGGGDNRYSASNSATLDLPLGATSGYNWNPGCTVRDAAGQSTVIGTGGFFIYLM
ncbi:MAG: hypothetical protein KBC34_00940 [Phenylobacterium sp.]|nr:hypothetical protein [Phenylobacterium sp.]